MHPLLVAFSLLATLTVTRVDKTRVDVSARDVTLASVASALGRHLAHPVFFVADGDVAITYEAKAVTADAALRAAAEKAGLVVVFEEDRYLVRDPREPLVTLDVKDADVREILKAMKEQCGIKNLVVDPNVGGSGTFYFKDVPCRAAFRTIFRSLDLHGVIYENSVISVEKGRR